MLGFHWLILSVSLLLPASYLHKRLVRIHPSSPSQPLIILIGPPLSGKATFAESISQTYRIPYISIEDLIRATVLNG